MLVEELFINLKILLKIIKLNLAIWFTLKCQFLKCFKSQLSCIFLRVKQYIRILKLKMTKWKKIWMFFLDIQNNQNYILFQMKDVHIRNSL